ncbi:MAG: hypothetical protein Roseis2KO_55830 [Roseivirga sp.]
MFRFKKCAFPLIAIVAAGLSLTSCKYEEPPISFQSNPDFFTRWNLVEETASCNQGSAYVSEHQGKEVVLRMVRNLTYEYYVEGEPMQAGGIWPLSKEISFTPSIHPNNIQDHSDYLLTGPSLIISTVEKLNQNSVETCIVRRVYHRQR